MREEPRFRIENSLPLLFVVFGRFMSYRKQLRQRQQRLRWEDMKMFGNARTKPQTVSTGDLKRAVNLSHAFLKPERPKRIVVSQQQVSVFVENDWKRGILRECQHNQILITAPMKKCRQIRSLAISHR